MTDINELFSRDPLKLTNEDIDAIILHMREKRAQFNSGALTPKKKAEPKLTTAQSAALKLNLDFKL